MIRKAIKRPNDNIGSDELVLKNGTGAAVSIGDVVAVQIDGNLDTAVPVTTARLRTVLVVATTACPNDATKTFRAVVQGKVKVNVANGVAAGAAVVGQNASVQAAAWAADAKAANISTGITLEASAANRLTLCLWSGFAFQNLNALP